jgi:dolichol-phosphate mannosyltransferase
MRLSIVIPAHNEAGNIGTTVDVLRSCLAHEGIDYEIVVVDDHSQDATCQEVETRMAIDPKVRLVHNQNKSGFGYAVRCGLDHFIGDGVVIFMADSSDDPADVIKYYYILRDKAECAFGSRFIKDSRVVDYPLHKLILNRLANWFIQAIFGISYNDTTNAFKGYRTNVIQGCRPFLSPHFNLTVEIPLKAIVRGYSYEVIPISWHNRAVGYSKLRIREMGSRYLFIVVYILLEKWLTWEDYKRPAGEKFEPWPAETNLEMIIHS